MVETTFKTMYLVSKSDLDNLENNNFKLSLQNKNICVGGMNVSVKPIKTRAQNKPPTKKTGKLHLGNDDSENDDEVDTNLPGKQVQTVGTNTATNQGEERLRKRKQDEEDDNDGKGNSGIDISTPSDEEDEIIRNRLKRLKGVSSDNYHEQPILKDSNNEMENIEEKRKMDEFDYNPIKGQTSALKRRKILHDIEKLRDDQWLRRIKTRLNDKRVQFKRKHDTIGYRINPDDITDQRERIRTSNTHSSEISKSLIKPSDFTYLNQTDSADFLDKWKTLKELGKKPFKNKRFRKYPE